MKLFVKDPLVLLFVPGYGNVEQDIVPSKNGPFVEAWKKQQEQLANAWGNKPGNRPAFV
ncbi:MAG: hypothetical protein PHG23_00460 [Candidatus Pacebacteria bacterium]|nr:hypothetical protein [Candidatus Paceibacterota bacterium]